MPDIHFDKCFVDGFIQDFDSLSDNLRYKGDSRYSFTDLKGLFECPRRFYEETWEDIGLQAKDGQAHGIVGHYLYGAWLKHCFLDGESFEEFKEEAIQLAEDVLTFSKSKDRSKLSKTYRFMDVGFLRRMYVTRMMDKEKYLDKVSNFLDNMNQFYWTLKPRSFKNLYVETGIYSNTPGGLVLFGKADLIVEHTSGNFSIVDHKSSFNTMFFNPLQLPFYATLLKKPIESLIVNDMSTGNGYRYSNQGLMYPELDVLLDRALSGVVYEEEEPAYRVGTHCHDCPITDCIDRQVNDSGYLEL